MKIAVSVFDFQICDEVISFVKDGLELKNAMQIWGIHDNALTELDGYGHWQTSPGLILMQLIQRLAVKKDRGIKPSFKNEERWWAS